MVPESVGASLMYFSTHAHRTRLNITANARSDIGIGNSGNIRITYLFDKNRLTNDSCIVFNAIPTTT